MNKGKSINIIAGCAGIMVSCGVIIKICLYIYKEMNKLKTLHTNDNTIDDTNDPNTTKTIY